MKNKKRNVSIYIRVGRKEQLKGSFCSLGKMEKIRSEVTDPYENRTIFNSMYLDNEGRDIYGE